MSTAELIEKIQALAPEQRKQVEDFVQTLVGEKGSQSAKYATSEEARIASDRIFEENAPLFKKLAE
ncbi:MAG: hypothetical protein ABI443_10350 [Chthoniobacterales bacterium]